MNEITDTERFRWLLANPKDGRHLLLLLSQGKGDENAFITILDRVIKSESASAHTQPAGAEP